MSTKTMIHDGSRTLVVPARRELREVPDPDGGEGAVKLEEVVVEKEREEKITLPPGTRFGTRLILVPHEVSDPEEQKALARHGFKAVSREQGKKLDAKMEKADESNPERVNAERAEFDRKRAALNQAGFEPRRGITGAELESTRKEVEKEGKK